MTDWSKLTVAKLKEACAERDVSITGLKLKQQFVDKLAEWESEQNAQAENDATAEQVEAEVEDGDDPKPEEINEASVRHAQVDDTEEKQREEEAPESIIAKADAEEETAAPKSADEEVKQDEPKPTQNGSLERPPSEENPVTDEAHPISNVEDNHQEQGEPLTAISDQPVDPAFTNTPQEAPAPLQASTESSLQVAAASSVPPADASTRSSSIVPLAEVQEDSRKRKRRSATPPPTADEIALKKAKANDGSPILRAVEAKEEQQTAIDEAGIDADAGPLAHVASPAVEPAQIDRIPAESSSIAPEQTSSPEREHHIDPSVHPATSTLYIRNFKRPLRAPDLQAHIASLARAKEDNTSDSDPIQFFYLDVIRTHAFVRLNSTTAAARVRSSLHNARWPDEPTRDALWVDYIPDDKAEAWANQEADSNAGSGFGGGRGGGQKRWEVFYDATPEGPVAVLLDASNSNIRRPSHQQQQPPQRNSIASQRKPSELFNPPTAPAGGVHPDRAALLPRNASLSFSQTQSSPRTTKQQEETPAFAALDSLFHSTQTSRPKLYYKPVSSEIAEERLNMLKRLRSDLDGKGGQGMGKSGDEGMKRYTFEVSRGREEWVDKGPEFGFGKRGRGRFAGGGEGGGRGRGGGGGGGYKGRGRGGGNGSGRASPGRLGGGKGYDWDAPPAGRRGGGGGGGLDSWRGGR